jgi:hypothetical protein
MPKDGPAWPVPMRIASKSGITSPSTSRRRNHNNLLTAKWGSWKIVATVFWKIAMLHLTLFAE